ncbi:MAG TPA: TlyA family RNA methyltransferase [Candidatus Limnocylindria bacterium]|nr:TlyA family RNA methyltransferase [Candidatus Limnocylindria bacterium]
MRLDDLLVERGIAPDRPQAARLLMAAQVRVGEGDGGRLDRKPGESVPVDIPIEMVARPRFVSRGGEKLDAALDAFAIDVTGRVCLDVGASTGGFTDVLLKRGATRVYALDVGRGQLAEVLRQDSRVISMERTHAARLALASADHVALPEKPSLAVIDVSFISLTRVLAGVKDAVNGGGEIVALVKPQFEAVAAHVSGGVVRDATVQRATIDRVVEYAVSIGMISRGEIESPLLGPKGNREFLVHLVAA